MAHKLILDADAGLGDALAVIVGLLDPEIDLVAVTGVDCVYGASQAYRNWQTVVEVLDPPKRPRLGGCDVESVEAPASESLDAFLRRMRTVHGPEGLGDWPVSEVDPVHPREAAKLFCDAVRDQPHEIVLLTTGPLTNVAMAIERDPEFLSRLKGLVCLGGCLDGPGDATAVADLNFVFNPEAARVVLRSPATKTLVPVDVARRAVLTFAHLQRLGLSMDGTHVLPGTVGITSSHFLRGLLTFGLRAGHQHLGIEGFPLAEVAALLSISRPALFQRQSLPCDVEVQGELTRGMTIFDRRRHSSVIPNLEVVRDFDVQGVLDALTLILQRTL